MVIVGNGERFDGYINNRRSSFDQGDIHGPLLSRLADAGCPVHSTEVVKFSRQLGLSAWVVEISPWGS
jgi:hypothetical protein